MALTSEQRVMKLYKYNLFIKKEINLRALKQHLIGKVGLDEREVMNLYREDKNDQR